MKLKNYLKEEKEEKEETHICKECGWEWTGTTEEWKEWKGPCPECDAPKSDFT